jgi:predicted Fe-Mo cluster-binding NifX family protein
MKVAVTAQGRELTSQVDPRFGRSACFLIVDTETGDHQVLDNTQNLGAAQGAGIQAAQSLVKQGVGAVLTGHCGPKAFQTLQAAGIEIYVGVTGTVQDALAGLAAGAHRRASSPDVEGHWV